MKYLITQKAFKGRMLHPGEVITVDEALPQPCSWAELVVDQPNRSAAPAPKKAKKVTFIDEDDGIESL